MSIKNHVATSISHIHIHNKPTIKTIHCTINVTSTKAKLFTICCGINQEIRLPQIKKIIVITNSLYAVKRIFDSSMHPYQIHSAAISHELREFFIESDDNHIEFWNCLSKLNWLLYVWVNKDTKSFISSPHFPSKLSWDFCKKCDFDSILAQWKMLFQASDSKGRNFLELLDNDSNLIKLSAVKGGLWLKHFSLSNSLYARATRAIINHAPISEYQLRFFPREEFSCPCRSYSIKSRWHILHDCRRFNNYWNLRRDTKLTSYYS